MQHFFNLVQQRICEERGMRRTCYFLESLLICRERENKNPLIIPSKKKKSSYYDNFNITTLLVLINMSISLTLNAY